jgi:Zn-dependent peptidase ImmA (M78 family)/DNA-binding XRE family transcriptional regulator
MAENEMKALFGQRLRNARIMRGLSLDALADKMGNVITKQAISKYEAGKSFPGSTVYIALAEALDVSPDFFVRPFSVSLDKIEFRKRSKLGVKGTASLKERIRDHVERYMEAESILGINNDFDYSMKDILVCKDKDAMKAAAQVRVDWKLGEDGIPYIIELLEEHKVKVIEIDAPDSFDGLSGFAGDRMPIIVLNKHYTVERKRFTALHELGHILLHFANDVDDKSKEHLCSTFANEMLISANVFKQLIGGRRHDISLSELRDVQKNFGISVDALMFKAKCLGVISTQRYTTYCITKNQNAIFKQQVEESLYHGDGSDRFQRLVYRALASDLISYSKAASLLNLPVNTIREQLALV